MSCIVISLFNQDREYCIIPKWSTFPKTAFLTPKSVKKLCFFDEKQHSLHAETPYFTGLSEGCWSTIDFAKNGNICRFFLTSVNFAEALVE